MLNVVVFIQVRLFTSTPSSVSLTTLKNPATWFPLARSMKRKIIAHLGPTNSGKTHAALQRLKESGDQGGIYCAPLRLLAMEMYDRLNTEGLKCGLATGEAIRGPKCEDMEKNIIQNVGPISDNTGKTDDQNMENVDSLKALFGYDSSTFRKRIQDAPFLSCTVEMADYGTPIGVAVIDEIQMMSDADRGWAFTHALLGLPAREIHVCGEPAAIPLLKKISHLLKEPIEIHTHYKRLVPLEVESRPLGKIHIDGVNSPHYCGSLALRKGDCVIAFSRRSIFLTKRAIETQTKRKVAVVYGTLPLESRTVQARLFNDPNSDYDVLVATDAIGMGLNLNIKRVIFSSLLKWDGHKKAMIPPQAIRQIAGRAGRFGSTYDERGLVTAYLARDLIRAKDTLGGESIPYTSAGIFPLYAQIEFLSTNYPTKSFDFLLDIFANEFYNRKSIFSLSSIDCAKKLAIATNSIDLSLKDRYTIICSPVSHHDPEMMKNFVFYASHISSGNPCPIHVDLPEKKKISLSSSNFWDNSLLDYETLHKTLNLYLWLSVRYPTIFVQRKEALEVSKKIETLIMDSLISMSELAISSRFRSKLSPSSIAQKACEHPRFQQRSAQR